MIYYTCNLLNMFFGHLYAHHQELETILVLLPHMVCNVLVAGCWWSAVSCRVAGYASGMKLCAAKFPSSRTHSLLLCS